MLSTLVKRKEIALLTIGKGSKLMKRYLNFSLYMSIFLVTMILLALYLFVALKYDQTETHLILWMILTAIITNGISNMIKED